MSLKSRLDRLEAHAADAPSGENIAAAWEALRRRVEAAHAADDYRELIACHKEGLRLSAFVPRVDSNSAEYRELEALPHDELLRRHAAALGLPPAGEGVRP